MTIHIGLSGATGKLGKTIIERIDKFGNCKISTKFNSTNNFDELDNFCKNSEVVIDFSTPEILEKLVDSALKHNPKLVIGTTGLTTSRFTLLKQAAKKLPILYSANMSLGANLLGYLARITAAMLDESYDIEILETHHRAKKDAPSGTAIMLGEMIAAEQELYVAFNRGNKARKHNEIGSTSIREDNVHGTHEIFFLGTDETITLQHQPLNKNSFADGAIKEAIWLHSKPPHLYSMYEIYSKVK